MYFPPCGECRKRIVETSYGWAHLDRPPHPHQARLSQPAKPRSLTRRLADHVLASLRSCDHPVIDYIRRDEIAGYLCQQCNRFFPTLEADTVFAFDDPEADRLIALLDTGGEALR